MVTKAVDPAGGATLELEPEGGDDSAQWDALAAELETPDLTDEVSEPIPGPGEGDKSKEDEVPPPALKQPTPEEHKNLQAALRQSRAKEQEAAQRLSGITQLIEQLRAGKGQQQAAKEEPAAPKQPTVEEDPIGYFQAELAKRDQVIQQLQQGTQQHSEQVQQHLQEQQFWGHVERSEVEMRKSTPDYDEACLHLESARISELEVMLPDESPRAMQIAQQYRLNSPAELRAAMLNRDRIAVAQQAVQLGMSPADLYYRLAKQRGFTGVQVPAGLGRLNGKTPGKGGNPQIEAARRGQAASKTIAGGDGGKADNPLNIADLTDLYADDPEEFDRQWDKLAKAGKLG